MLEGRLTHASTLKKIVEAVKDVISEANFDCNDSGITLQCMDSGHVALVLLQLNSDGFEDYRCDRNITLGINFAALTKVLKCAANDDSLTLKADDSGDRLNFVFESQKGDRVSEFDMKLMTIDAELLSIPDNDYDVTIKMSSAEFSRICKDLANFGETMNISADKESVRFGVEGDVSAASVVLRPNETIDEDEKIVSTSIMVKKETNVNLSMKFLKTFANSSLAGSVTLELQDDIPCLIKYVFPNDLGVLCFYLAPKGDEDNAEE